MASERARLGNGVVEGNPFAARAFNASGCRHGLHRDGCLRAGRPRLLLLSLARLSENSPANERGHAQQAGEMSEEEQTAEHHNGATGPSPERF